ncbi:MAG: dipeptidase [Acidobacteriia bacterium]|nr:dipeptidase [Terriglobia bacterium]
MRPQRFALLSVLLLAVSVTAQVPPKKPDPPAASKFDPLALHTSSIVIDTHADTTQLMLDENYDLATPDPAVNVNLEKARAGNLGAEFFSIWVEPKYKGQYAHRAMQLIDAVYQQAARHPNEMVMAFSADDIVKARTGPKKRLAALLGIEGGHAIENDLGILRDFYRLGVRYMTLTWSNTNDWADSSGDIENKEIPHHNGITDLGVDVIREMNRLGMLVDISHVSDRTFYRTLVVSRAPVIASHSSARALSHHPRNMTDDMLRALARSEGVCMVNFFSAFVDEDFRKLFEARRDEAREAVAKAQEEYSRAHNGQVPPYTVEEHINREYAAKLPRPPLKSLIDQIDHIAKVAGWQHVGLGSDFDGVSGMLPQGIDSAADLPKITVELAKRGYTAEQIRGILGENFLRVFREVERVSRELKKETPLGKEPLGAGENR